MAVKGVFASHQNIVGSRRGDFAAALLQTMPTGMAPMFALSAGMSSRDLADTVATWFEENHLSGRINITNNAGTGTSIIVNDATQVVANQVYLIESTGEYIFVESVSGSTLTVTRGMGSSSASAVDGSVTAKAMQLIGTAFEEGSSKPTSVANVGFPRFNYAQIFRNAWDVTGTAQAIDFYTGPIEAKNRADALLQHSEAIERSSIWGIQAIGTFNGKSFRMMDGIKAQLSTNLKVQSSNTKYYNDVVPFLRGIFETNIKGQPNERLMFCGNQYVQTLNDCARKDSTTYIEPGQNVFGLQVMRLVTPFGSVNMVTHPLFNENATFTKDALIVHPAAIEWRYLRRTHTDDYNKDGTRAGTDGDFGVVTTEGCITYKAEKTGGYHSGVDTAAAST